MCYVNLRHKTVESITLPKGSISGKKYYRFTINDGMLHVDLDQGHMILSPDCENQSLQLITLAFVTSMLYLMVQPHPPSSTESESDPLPIPGNISPRYIDANNVAFLLMCGWSIRNHVPTNSTLRQTTFCAYGTGSGCIAGGAEADRRIAGEKACSDYSLLGRATWPPVLLFFVLGFI